MFTRNVGPTLGTGRALVRPGLGAGAAGRRARRGPAQPAAHRAAHRRRRGHRPHRRRRPRRCACPTPPRRHAPTSSTTWPSRSTRWPTRWPRSRGLEQQFLLSVSHDLRTPLTSIQGYAEAIADGAAPDDRAAAGVILAESRRLERLVRDLLDLAKLEARQFSLDLVPGRPRRAGRATRPTASGREVEAAGLAPAARRRSGGPVRRRRPTRPAGPGRGQPGRERPEVRRRLDHAGGRSPTRTAPRIEVADDGPGHRRRRTCPTCSSASTWPATSRCARRSGRASAWPSSASWSTPWAAPVRAEADPGGGARMVVTLRPPTPSTTPPSRSFVRLGPPRRRPHPRRPIRRRRRPSRRLRHPRIQGRSPARSDALRLGIELGGSATRCVGVVHPLRRSGRISTEFLPDFWLCREQLFGSLWA